MKLLNFEIGVVASCQKLAIILENKVILKWFKNWCYSSMKKKNQKYSDDFWHFESQILTLFDTSHYTNSQNSMISFDYSWFVAKNLSILYPSHENSKTGIAIIVHWHQYHSEPSRFSIPQIINWPGTFVESTVLKRL